MRRLAFSTCGGIEWLFMEILEKLFGSAAKVKIIKLFLFNPESAFDYTEAAERAKVSKAVTRREIANLEKIGFVKQKVYIKEIRRQKNRKVGTVRKKAHGWILDQRFPYLESLKSFLSNIEPFKHKDIVQKICRTGKIQLLIMSGIFIKEPEAPADLLVVGDNIRQGLLDKIIRSIEAEIGREISYIVFETPDFNYRYSIFDKTVRDILDAHHEKVINKLNL